MKLELKVETGLCEPMIFRINDIEADYEDFGEKHDWRPDDAEPYGCGEMRFTSFRPRKEVMDKYHIGLVEYYQICEKLIDELSFGHCGWCI
nr:MAG TPA_asm: hypothetical protein [Caudoviricetes sp.]